MPDPKKILVKVLKKTDPEKSEKEKGVKDKESASENKMELTKHYSDSQKKMQNAADSPDKKKVAESAQGISIDNKSLSAKPKLFKRKIISSGGENGSTRIMSSDGKTVKYEGRTNMQATKDAIKNNSKDEKYTNARRESNSNYYNVNSGAKKDLDKEDKETLVRNLKAVKK
jgi:hypothetical protein